MELNRCPLYLIGCLVVGLNILQATCHPANVKVGGSENDDILEKVGDGESQNTNDISANLAEGEKENDNYYYVLGPTEAAILGIDHSWYLEFQEKARHLQEISNDYRRLLTEKKEIKELFGEESSILKKFKQLNYELGFFAGGELAIRYYLKNHPNHAELLDAAVDIWIGIVLESNQEFKRPSKEIYQNLFNAEPQSNYFTEIANQVIEHNPKMISDLEKSDFTQAVVIKLNNFIELLSKTEVERITLRKISAFFKQGLFDDICESLGDEKMDLLFSVFSSLS